jgi:hypothetical protein
VLTIAADAPNVTDWLQAWGTVAGALLSSLAVVIALTVVRNDRRARREDKHDADSAQARLVYIRVAGARGDPEGGWEGCSFVIRNNSDGEVTNVRVGLSTTGDIDVWHAFRRPIAARKRDGGLIHFGESLGWPFEVDAPSPSSVDDFVTAEIIFTDSSGMLWRRRGTYPPERLPDVGMPHQSMPSLIAEYLRLPGLWRSMRRVWRVPLGALRLRIRRRLLGRQASGRIRAYWQYPRLIAAPEEEYLDE